MLILILLMVLMVVRVLMVRIVCVSGSVNGSVDIDIVVDFSDFCGIYVEVYSDRIVGVIDNFYSIGCVIMY